MIAYKYRIYPNQEQRDKIAQHLGCSRFVYNWGLATKMEQYQIDKTTLSCFDLTNRLKNLKDENEWLRDADSQSLQMALRNLDNAYTRFFREKKGFPRFRSKHNNRQLYQIPQRCKIEGDKVKIPKLGLVKAKIHRECLGKTGTWTISKTPTNEYFVSILTDYTPAPKQLPNRQIGIDLGIKTYATCSDGVEIENPEWLRVSSKKLATLQRRASHKQKGSANRRKANFRVAKQYEKITSQRRDWQHKWSAKITSENKVVALEDLGVANMLKNHNLAKGIQDCAWSQFVSFLEYKAQWSGCQIVKIGRFEPSSRLCVCGKINHELTLADRVWTCQNCGRTHQRDVLASQNILRFAQKLISGQELPVEPVELSAVVGAMKQEAQSLAAG